MSSWTRRPLGLVAHLRRGYDLPSQDRGAGEVPIVSSSGISGFHEVAAVKGPGVITGRTGTLGEVHYIETDFWPLNTTLYVDNFFENSPRFIAYLLQTIDLAGGNTNSSVPGLNRNHLHRLEVFVPPRAEQDAIARLLGSLDDKVELNRKTSATIEELARALFASWFGVLDPDRAPDGWMVASLSDLIEPTRGLSYTSAGLAEDGIPLHNLDSIADIGGYSYEGIKYYQGEYQPRHVVRAADLLIVNTDLTWAFQRIAQPALVPERFGDLSLFSADLFRVRPIQSSWLTTRFLYLALMSPRLRQLVVGYSNGTTVNHLAIDGLKRPRLAVPPVGLVQRFDKTVQPFFAKQEQLQLESETFAKLRDLLLPKLMSGEIHLSEAEKAVAEAG